MPETIFLFVYLPGRRSQTDRLICCGSPFYKSYLQHDFPERTLKKILRGRFFKKQLAAFN